MVATERDSYDFYDILNVTKDSSIDEIKSNYRELSLLYHPDKQATSPLPNHLLQSASDTASFEPQDTSPAFLKIQNAYKVLSNEKLRFFYDKYGSDGLSLLDEAEKQMEAESYVNIEASEREPFGPLSHMKDPWAATERKMQSLARDYQEMASMQLLSSAGQFSIATMTEIFQPTSHRQLKAKLAKMLYSSCSQQFALTLNPSNSVIFGYNSHLQSNAAGAAKLMAAWKCRWSPQLSWYFAAETLGSHLFHSWHSSVTRKIGNYDWLTQKTYGRGGVVGLGLNWLTFFTEKSSAKLKLAYDDIASVVCELNYKEHLHHIKCKAEILASEISVSSDVKLKRNERNSFVVSPSFGMVNGLGIKFEWIWRPGSIKNLTKLKYAIIWRLESLSINIFVQRAGIVFNFPIQLYLSKDYLLWPSVELLYLLMIAATPPLVCTGVARAYKTFSRSTLKQQFYFLKKKCKAVLNVIGWNNPIDLEISLEPSGPPESLQDEARSVYQSERLTVATAESSILERVAELRRETESSCNGLIILAAHFGNPTSIGVMPIDASCVIDVTIPVMAKVRHSALLISSASKKQLIGFCNPCSHLDVEPQLFIRYSYGSTVLERVFEDTAPVSLP